MAEIRFSIIITCHNQRDFISVAVDSALSQNHRLREIIVVDDGSTDGSKEILERYADSIELLCFPSNRGAIEARNQGVARAKGEYLVFLDGDDLLMPRALDIYERIIAERNPKIVRGQPRWFTGAIPRTKEQDAPHKVEFVEYENLMCKDRMGTLLTGTFVVNRRTFEDIGRWTPGIFHLDLQDMFLKLGYSGRTVWICSPVTAFYRIHATNSIHSVEPFLQMEYRLIDKERRGEYPGGRKHRYERRAYLGGQIVFCIKKAMQKRLHKEAVRLAVSGWSLILAALLRRSAVWIKGRRPLETLEFPTPENSLSHLDAHR